MKIYLILALALTLLPAVTYAKGIDQIFERTKRFGEIHSYDTFTRKHAVVIGISDYKGAFEGLAHSAQNALRMKDFLIKEAGFDSVHVLTDEGATLKRVKSLLQVEMPKILGPDDQFILYWSGHGVTSYDGSTAKGYLPAADSRQSDLNTHLSINELVEIDRGLQAKQTFYVLDADLDGFTGFAKRPLSNQVVELTSGPSRQILTAGYSGQQAPSRSRFRDNTFTNAIISGLRGFADGSIGRSNKNEIISSAELVTYVRHHAKTRNSQLPTPALYDLSNQPGNLYFKKRRYRPRPSSTSAMMMVKPKPKTTKMAEFPWPPPKASGLQVLEADFLEEDTSLYEAANRIATALRAADHHEHRYYSVPNGFAIATRLELIDKDGERIEKLYGDEIDFLQYLKGLFWKSPKGGNFRMVIFIVTDQGFGTNGDELTRDKADTLFQDGHNALDRRYKDYKLTEDHTMTALVYEFFMPPNSKKASVNLPGNLTVQTHLRKAGWYDATGKLN